MGMIKEVLVPDLGGTTDVGVIEILVAPGAVVAENDPLVTLVAIKTDGGRTFKNIAKVTGDTLTICRAREEDDFPKSFTSEYCTFTVYKRVGGKK